MCLPCRQLALPGVVTVARWFPSWAAGFPNQCSAVIRLEDAVNERPLRHPGRTAWYRSPQKTSTSPRNGVWTIGAGAATTHRKC